MPCLGEHIEVVLSRKTSVSVRLTCVVTTRMTTKLFSGLEQMVMRVSHVKVSDEDAL